MTESILGLDFLGKGTLSEVLRVSDFGGAEPKIPPNGNPSSAPSTRTARTARTTRQINGAKSFGG